MSKGKSEKIVYKPYEQKQLYLISKNHLVRVVKRVVEEMDMEETRRYHPEMLIKVLVYSYLYFLRRKNETR